MSLMAEELIFRYRLSLLILSSIDCNNKSGRFIWIQKKNGIKKETEKWGFDNF